MNPELDPKRALSPHGVFAARWPQFEYRPAQEEMAALVWSICQKGGYALIEAGTGTGKSLAYLYPVFYGNIEKTGISGPVIISTHTINLQQQLFEKEIPFLNETLGVPIQAALLLGRGNYLCLRKLHYFRQNPRLLEDGLHSCFTRVWTSAQRQVGSVEQLGYALPLALKEKITSEGATCLRKHCPFQQRCFWMAARKKAFAAQVVIVNHHLFFTDLAVRRQREFNDEGLVLPPYQLVIFDEAHHLAEVAAEHLGTRIDQKEINHFCHRLLHQEGKWGRGWLPSLRQRLIGAVKDLALMQRLIGIMDGGLMPGLRKLETLFNGFFLSLASHEGLAASLFQGNDIKRRFTSNLLANPDLNGQVTRLLATLDEWTGQLSRFVDGLPEEEALREDFIFLAEAGHFFTGIAANLPLLLDGRDDHFVFWLEGRPEGELAVCATLQRVPLNLGELLSRELFTQLQGGVLTSATLAVEGEFSYIKENLGLSLLPTGTCREVILPSPFNYQEHVLVIVPSDLPSLEDPNYLKAVSLLLPSIIEAAGGRSLLLFTNRQQMNQIYARISCPLKAAGIQLLRQGEEPRHHLLSKFIRSPKTVLMGMDSFWEGVDIPGPQLSNVIIMRLPFRVPTEPLFQAQWEALAKEGKDPFLHLSLPEAVIKFKQGFGRLIRTQTDRGVVVVLDQRIKTKRYGRVFLRSIPGGKLITAPQTELASLIQKWLT
ncbi:MAG TPA: hypothetical protein GXZ98_06215 [Firmicutes bacterium]|jgi:ATP-dependent DNA helicase DinG|nr:hypothetical protein [Bacillota bacterium]